MSQSDKDVRISIHEKERRKHTLTSLRRCSEIQRDRSIGGR